MAGGGGGNTRIYALVGGGLLAFAGMGLHAGHVGPGWLSAALLAIGGLVGLIVLASFLGRSDEHDAKERYEELMLDDRYRRALDILHEKHDEAEATSGQASESSEEPSDSALEESTLFKFR